MDYDFSLAREVLEGLKPALEARKDWPASYENMYAALLNKVQLAANEQLAEKFKEQMGGASTDDVAAKQMPAEGASP